VGSLRFRRSVRLAPGVRLNFNKRSVGVSMGVRGARYSVNSDGRRTRSLGIPGTGLSYRSQSGPRRRTASSDDPVDLFWKTTAPKYIAGALLVLAAIKFWYVSVPVGTVILFVAWLRSQGSRPQSQQTQQHVASRPRPPQQGLAFRMHPTAASSTAAREAAGIRRADAPAPVRVLSPEERLLTGIRARDARAVESVGNSAAQFRVIAYATAALLLLPEAREEDDSTAKRIEGLLEAVWATGEEPWTHPFRTKYDLDLQVRVPLADGVVSHEIPATRSALGLLLAAHYCATKRFDRAQELCTELENWRGLMDPQFSDYLRQFEDTLRDEQNAVQPTRAGQQPQYRPVEVSDEVNRAQPRRAERRPQYRLVEVRDGWEIHDCGGHRVFAFDDAALAQKTLRNLEEIVKRNHR
jgi:Protein of unknown function (DUF4236)